jgi:hypothetical protein
LGKDVDEDKNTARASAEEAHPAVIGDAAGSEEGELPGRECEGLGGRFTEECAGMYAWWMGKNVWVARRAEFMYSETLVGRLGI